MKQIIFLFCLILACGCSTSNNQEKHESKRNNIINVHNQVKEIDTGDVLISESHRAYPFDEYLAIADYKGYEKMIHIFDSKTYNYLASTGDPGQGPGELSNFGDILWNRDTRQMYTSDYSSMTTYAFLMDSVLSNPSYKPEVKREIKKIDGITPSNFVFLNDTLAFAVQFISGENFTWKEFPCRFNFSTGQMKRIDYPYPELKKRRILVAASQEKNRIIVVNKRYDILSVIDFNGNLLYNVFGPDWDIRDNNRQCFGRPVIFKDKILALYDGRKYSDMKQHSKVLVFSLDGDYIKTLETGYEIAYLTLDETNRRLILSCNDEIQFGYLDLDEVL